MSLPCRTGHAVSEDILDEQPVSQGSSGKEWIQQPRGLGVTVIPGNPAHARGSGLKTYSWSWFYFHGDHSAKKCPQSRGSSQDLGQALKADAECLGQDVALCSVLFNPSSLVPCDK